MNSFHLIDINGLSSERNMTNIITSPLDQFDIRNLLSLEAPVLGNLSLSITNIALYVSIRGYLIITLTLLSTNNRKIYCLELIRV